MQPGRDEGMMEDGKAAPALRARSLRSYVPLRLRPERKCVLRRSLIPSRRKLSPLTNPNLQFQIYDSSSFPVYS